MAALAAKQQVAAKPTPAPVEPVKPDDRERPNLIDLTEQNEGRIFQIIGATGKPKEPTPRRIQISLS
jgi:hypothetical protein